ncbi:hypothetical protein MY4824_001489 [Beauveria thailandica]
MFKGGISPFGNSTGSLEMSTSCIRSLRATFAIREVGCMGSYWSCATPEQHLEIERSDIFSDDE